MRGVLLFLFLLNYSYANNIDFLFDSKMKSTDMLKKLKKVAKLKESKVKSYYTSKASRKVLSVKTFHTVAYVVNDKLIWTKLNLYNQSRDYSIRKAFLTKFGEGYESSNIKNVLKEDSKVRNFIWKRPNGRSITLTESERTYENSSTGETTKYVNYELEVNNYAKVPSQRGPGKKLDATVLLTVPVMNSIYANALSRAASYTLKYNFHSLGHYQFKTDQYELWKGQRLDLNTRSEPLSVESNLYYYFSRFPLKLGHIDESLLKSRSFGEFKRFVWNKLISHRPVVLDFCAVVKGEKKTAKDSEGKDYTYYSYPYMFKKDFIDGRYPYDGDTESFGVREFKLLIIGMDQFKGVAMVSLENGEAIEVPLKTLYTRSSRLHYF